MMPHTNGASSIASRTIFASPKFGEELGRLTNLVIAMDQFVPAQTVCGHRDLMRSDHTSRYQWMSAIRKKRTSLFAPHMSAFRGIADATIVVALLPSSRVVATSHRIRASEQVVPREEQEKDNR